MNESRWEASRRSSRKNGIVVLLVLVGVSSIIGVLIVNNRDQMESPSVNNSIAAPQKDPVETPPDSEIAAAVPVPAKIGGTLEVAPPSPETTVVADRSPPPAPPPAAVAPQRPRGDDAAPAATRRQTSVPLHSPPAKVTAKVKTVSPPAGDFLQSIQLPAIRCSVDSRKDVVIYLSLELFFEDAEKRSAVFLRRDDIKVMVMKALRGKELIEITIGMLEFELHGAINQLFDHSEIVAVKISDIRIEKAVKE